ncbi:hypothetical protein F5Y08DRAFT_293256 [Xylaria arbuscula]|nr:hypothetical protein F5Y08DRAFT_293256 [Xylaria arbuscula]
MNPKYESITQSHSLGSDSTAPGSRLEEPASWGLEISGLVVSALLLAAQVGVLIWVMDKPYYEVWKVPLSLNTVVAIITITYKACILHAVGEAIGQLKWVDFKTRPRRLKEFELYDATSRGPQGALELVLKVRWGLATFGAFIVLLSLAVDPFIQQVIELTPSNVVTPDTTAVFGFARSYDTGQRQASQNGIPNPEISSRDPGIQGAIMRGIYNIHSPDEFQCGGACSWNTTYKSLGFTSTCRNITEAAEAAKACSTEDYTIYCNYTTPAGVYFSTEYVRTDSATSLIVAVNDTFYSSLPGLEIEPRLSPEFLQVAVFQSNNAWSTNFNADEIIPDNITECTLSLSLHEYSNITANGSDISFSQETRQLEPAWYLPDTETGEITLLFNQSEAGVIDPPLRVNAFDFASAILFFESSAFRSHIISGNAQKGKDTDRVGTGGAFLNADVPTVFTALAKSMTDYVRSLSKGPNVETGKGSRIESIVFVRIRWEWLALPIIEELAAIAFVVWVIIHNRRHRIPGWKSTALAVLMHNLDGHHSLMTDFQGPEDIKKRLEKVEARLQ